MKDKFILIENVTILTMNNDREVIENGVVLIEDDEIIEVGTKEVKERIKDINNVVVIDGKEGILMPGMVNCHTHGSMIPFRSLADDYKDRLKKYLFPLEQKLVDKDLVYKGAKYAIAEMLLGGVTTFCDMYYFEDEVAKAAKEMNMRAVLCETVVDFPAPDSKEAFGGLEYSRDFIKKWLDDPLITPGIAPHAPYTNSDESLKEAFKISKEFNVPLTMHVAEMDYEYNKYKNEYGLTPIQYLDSLGILDENFISAHTVLVDDKDIEIIKERKVKVSHNIGANAKGAKGLSPILKMREKNIDIGLGTDGPMSGNTIDIITQMSLVGKIHKLFSKDRTVLPSVELIEMATIGGARVLGKEKIIGSIEKNKKADLVLFETESVNMQPIYDYYSTIVYSSNPSNVNTVIINGEIVIENKKLISDDFSKIRKDLIDMKGKIATIAANL
jgi:5-methylthioadenosine/S-adenosylhomocysteine deaminase